VRLLAAGLALACAVVTASAGCSFLIAFDDQPSCDGGLCASEASVAADAPNVTVDAARPDDAEAGPPPPPRDAGPDTYDPCNGVPSGAYCATDQLHGWVGPTNYLVFCQNNAVARADLCDGGCLSMPNPFPDTCSGCPGKPDGVYCGRDFPNFPKTGDGSIGDDDFLIACQAGNVSTNYPCPHGCKSNGAAASCYP
jgi:hypothetical protein